MEQRIKKSIFFASLTYGAIITGFLDFKSNFHIVTYLALYTFFVLIIWYRFYKRLPKVKFVESKFLSILFPLIIAFVFGFKIAKIAINAKAPNIGGKWKVIELVIDNEKIHSESPICDRLIFWKHGIMILKEKGIYNLRYHFGLNDRLNIDGGSIRKGHSNNYCVERTILRNMDIVNSYIYKLKHDTLRLENSRQKLVLIKEE